MLVEWVVIYLYSSLILILDCWLRFICSYQKYDGYWRLFIYWTEIVAFYSTCSRMLHFCYWCWCENDVHVMLLFVALNTVYISVSLIHSLLLTLEPLFYFEGRDCVSSYVLLFILQDINLMSQSLTTKLVVKMWYLDVYWGCFV